MNFHNNDQIKSKTIENRNNQNTIRKKINKFSKSQTTSNILNYELFNKKRPINKEINNNYSNSFSEKGNELYEEEINYNIDSTKNNHDTTYFTNHYKNIKKDDSNFLNNENIMDKKYAQKEYWLEEKNSYIKELEKKIKKQNNIINGLLNNESSSKITNSQDKVSNSSSYLDYNLENKNMIRKLSRKGKINRTFIDDLPNNELNIDEATNNSNKYSTKSKMSNDRTKPKDKYDKLYSKYLNLLNDFKYLNNNKNNNENSLNKLKNKYNSLLEETKNLKSKINSKNKIIKNQQKQITEIKKVKNENNEEEKDLIKNLREQTEAFRKDLVLSQAMVNSLKAEIEVLKKSNNFDNSQFSNKRNKNLNKSNKIFDKYNFTFNRNNNNQSGSISPKNDFERYNNIINNNDYLSNNLNSSLDNKDKLLTKVLQENNLLRNRLKKFDSFLPNFVDVYEQNDFEELNKKNLIKNYEEKFQYFSFYIKRMKIIIDDLFKDIPFILNKYLNKNNSLSEKFIIGLYELRKEYYTIKKIDEFNLDITDDEKCIKIYTNLIKLLNKELESFADDNNNINNYNKANLNDNALSNITNLSNNNISSSKFNNLQYLDKDVKNDNDLIFSDNFTNKNNLNLTDLNTGGIKEVKNNFRSLSSMENIFKTSNAQIINKVNSRKTYITNYGNKNRNKSANNHYNREYNFEYGIDSNNNLMSYKGL